MASFMLAFYSNVTGPEKTKQDSDDHSQRGKETGRTKKGGDFIHRHPIA
jgi:hypothetical protein